MDATTAEEVDLNVSLEDSPHLADSLAVPAQGRSPEDGNRSRDGSKDSSQKRKLSEREPESPSNNDVDGTFTPFAKREKLFYSELEDSPASYPKHVLVPAAERQAFEEKSGLAFALDPSRPSESSSVLTPDSQARRRDSNMDGSLFARDQHYPEVYRAPSYQEIEYNRSFGCNPNSSFEAPPVAPSNDSQTTKTRRWACDYCNVATFLSYDEACTHEAACARRHHETQQQGHLMNDASSSYENTGVVAQAPPPPGAMYQSGQEVVTPPTPHQHHQSRYGQGPPLPVLPHEQGYYHPVQAAYYEHPDYYGQVRDPYGYYQQPHQQMHSAPYNYMPVQPQRHQQQKRMLLAMPTDNESLSDRQCYVRSEMLEIFAATEKDVAARHSKGAQKLQVGQVGIRCVHCSHLRPRDRAERAVCYPSSISRIYQTVADMQRFHFEQCQQIPDYVRQVYGKLKTTRPRGVGSPQTYWVQSAKSLGLVDTKVGIRFNSGGETEQPPMVPSTGYPTPRVTKNSDMSISTL